MIYLDNAATTFPKPKCVVKEVARCIKEYCGNPGRSSHKLSLKASEEIYKSREAVAALLSLENPENVCFTTNTTYALNMAIKSTITEKCHVLLSDIEHNATLRPIIKLSETLGVEYSFFSTTGNLEENINKAIRPNTKVIISTLVSNVSGESVSLNVLSRIAGQKGATLIIDAAQALGHTTVNLKETPCDILCAPAHKGLLGIQGAGFAVFCSDKQRSTFIEGGSGTESKDPHMPVLLPERYEAGTLPTPSIVSLNAGINYIRSIGIENIEAHIKSVSSAYIARLMHIKKVRLYGVGNGIISFSVDGIPSSKLSGELDRYGICARGGLHCAPLAHKKLKTDKDGLLRISFSALSKLGDADTFYKTLNKII